MKSRAAILEVLTARCRDIPRQVERIKLYIARKELKNAYGSPPSDAYDIIGQYKFFDAVALALNGKPWKGALASANQYRLFSQCLEYYWHYRFRKLFRDHPHPLRMVSWERMSETLASCLVVNQVNEAVHLGYLSFAALNSSYQLAISYSDCHRRAQAFMLRLFADYQGGMRHDWPRDLLIQPVYEDLLVHWRTPDPDQIKKLLIDACDRHIREARRDTTKSFYDFNDESMMRTPLEILMTLRLRDLIGLSNPTLRHDLMKFPFDKLPATELLPQEDLMMQATLARLRRDWPDYDDVVSLECVKRAAFGSKN